MEKKRFKPHEYIEPEDMAKILAIDTMHASNIYMETFDLKVMENKYWAWMHIGFTAALHILGYDSEYCNRVIELVKAELTKK